SVAPAAVTPEMLMPQRFGERIRKARKEKGLGLRATARDIGISATFLSRIESGKEDAVPREEVIRKLAAILDDDFDELMALAGRVSQAVRNHVREDPQMPEFLRQVRERNIPAEELLEMLRKKKEGND
ncbi:MAG: helix-turn-helix transcriptional regulator, partial [Myxococcales bacterium]|nr:helix-turn-helix transcriptional regulator [Myxococcales bacterium]